MIRLKCVTFARDATTFRCGGDSDYTWIADRRDCEIWIDGQFCYVKHKGEVAFAHVARVAHAVALEEERAPRKTRQEALAT